MMIDKYKYRPRFPDCSLSGPDEMPERDRDETDKNRFFQPYREYPETGYGLGLYFE